MTTKKTNWAEVDKRVRERRAVWTSEELRGIEDDLQKLPDVSDQIEVIDLAQPAIGTPRPEDEAAS